MALLFSGFFSREKGKGRRLFAGKTRRLREKGEEFDAG